MLNSEQAASAQTAISFCAGRGIDSEYFSIRKYHLAKQSMISRFVSVTAKPLESQQIKVSPSNLQFNIPPAVSAQWLADFIKALA